MSTMNSTDPDEVITEKPTDLSAIPALNRAEIDIQIATARRFPRSIRAFKTQALEMATLDEETAGSMFYVLPRDGKRIEGPSIRLAEIVGSAWGNVRYGSRIMDVTGRAVIAQGACFDLEKNVACAVEVSRRITTKQGRVYSDDMINTTAQAAMSIALRNAIFRVVPLAYVKDILEQAKLVSLGKGLTMEQQRTKAIAWFAKLSPIFTEPVVLKIVGRSGLEDVSVEDLVVLRGIATALKDGETSVEDVLRQLEPEQWEPVKPGEGGGLDQLTQKLQAGLSKDQPA